MFTPDLFQPKSKNKGNCKFLNVVYLISIVLLLLESNPLITIPTPSIFDLPKISILLFNSPFIFKAPSHTITPVSINSILAPASISSLPFTVTTFLIT